MGAYVLGAGVTITETFTVLGALADPTTVTFTVKAPDGTEEVFVSGVDPEVTHPSLGVYVLTLDPPTQVGTYHYQCVGTGAVEASSIGEFSITPDITFTSPFPQFGPCSPWIDAQDVAACAGIEVTAANADDLAAQAVSASQIMFELSARLFTGRCERTVRPCADDCGCWGIQRLSTPDGGWHWLPLEGYWGWDGFGSRRHCGCACLSRVLLPGYPVWEITEVKIDGDVITPSSDDPEYRLDEWRWLTRMNGQYWPSCQNLDLDDDQPGTFSVSYVSGVEPPLAGKQAAAQLGAELYAACTTGECKLPSKATRIIRQGVTVDRLQPLASMLRRGETGLPAIDAFIGTYNPSGLRRRPAFWSPDGPRYARPVG